MLASFVWRLSKLSVSLYCAFHRKQVGSLFLKQSEVKEWCVDSTVTLSPSHESIRILIWTKLN